MGEGDHAELRALPPVHALAADLDAPHALAVAAARRALEEQRAILREGGDPAAADIRALARAHLQAMTQASLRPVINATGVILHTNLGRAPLAAAAREAVAAAAGYTNLELELDSGARGSRHDHVAGLLRELTGAPAAMAVSNGAGAVLLAVAALAAGRGVVVSRGQLVEIGGGFRIPDVVAQSGATLIEVGTTNRTHRRDYERAVAGDPTAGAILRVHQSNFRTQGFVSEVAIEELCALGLPVVDDLGSGVLAGAAGLLALGDEPDLRRSIAAGAALVCCSGDKLLGGPQAGLLVGTETAIAAARAHPLARALRLDKLSLAALEATLRLHRDPVTARREIPVLAMLDVAEDVLADRARRLAEAIGPATEIVRVQSRVGGGALPLAALEGPAVALTAACAPDELATRLRIGDPPVVTRVHDGRVVLDPRTLAEDEIPLVAAAVRAAGAGG